MADEYHLWRHTYMMPDGTIRREYGRGSTAFDACCRAADDWHITNHALEVHIVRVERDDPDYKPEDQDDG